MNFVLPDCPHCPTSYLYSYFQSETECFRYDDAFSKSSQTERVFIKKTNKNLQKHKKKVTK